MGLSVRRLHDVYLTPGMKCGAWSDPEATDETFKLPVELLEGDLRSAPSLRRAVAGCDSLFHVAADYRLWVPNPETMYDINVRGTQALILAAAEAGVKRMIYTSSVATLGTNQDGIPANEETPPVL